MIALDRAFDRLVLPEHEPFQVATDMRDDFRIALRNRLWRHACHRSDGRFDLLRRDPFLPLAFRHEHLRGAGLVDHVDGLVGQLAVMDIPSRQLDRRLDGFVRVLQLVVVLENGLKAFQNFDRILDGRLLDVDLLEAAHQRPILLEVLAIFLVCRRADAAQRARLQRRL